MDKENKVDPEIHTHFKEFYCFFGQDSVKIYRSNHYHKCM